MDETILVESGAPDFAENSKLGYEKVKGEYVRAEDGGLALYIRSDMRFEGGGPLIDRRDYKGVAYLIARNVLDE